MVARRSMSGTPINRALGAADTVARLLNTSDVGWRAGVATDDGPLFARLAVTADDGQIVIVTVEQITRRG